MFTVNVSEVAIIVAIVLTGLGFHLIHLVIELRKELFVSHEAYEFIQKKLIEANNDKATYVDVIDLLSERDSN